MPTIFIPFADCPGACDFCDADITVSRISRLAAATPAHPVVAVLAETDDGRMLRIALSAQAVRVIQRITARAHSAGTAPQS